MTCGEYICCCVVYNYIFFNVLTVLPVMFSRAAYIVREGDDANAVITLVALHDHDFGFTVTVLTRNGTAVGN